MGKSLVSVKVTAVKLFIENGLDPILDEIKKKIQEFSADASTASGRKEIGSFAHKIAQSKVFIDNAGKELVAKQKAEIKLIDSERKRARDWLDAQKAAILEPRNKWEEAEAKRIADEKAEKEFNDAFDEAIVENDLFDRQKEIERKEAEIKAAEEAAKAKEEAERIKKEQAEREERLKKEAAEKAVKDAEEAHKKEMAEAAKREKAAIEAKEKADRDRIAAAARAKAEKELAVENARKEAEYKAAKEKRDEEIRLASIKEKEEKKAANKRHRASVNNYLCAEFVAIGIPKNIAESLIEKIADGEIKNILIQY